jgi:hypothetical protein
MRGLREKGYRWREIGGTTEIGWKEETWDGKGEMMAGERDRIG